MSYRDLRNFTEMMRALGYPRLISIENFRKPNFPLVSEIIVWLVQRFDPDLDMTPQDINQEKDRINLIRNVAQFMASKAHIRLNTKKLYQADGYAVKELIKVTTLLYNAMKANANIDAENPPQKDGFGLNLLDVTSKINEIKQLRQLGSEITTKGSGLHSLLINEVDLRELRMAVLDKQIELTEVESAMRKTNELVNEEIVKTNSLIENVASNEANLDAKIKKKQVELERTQKRLQTLRKVRPAFMDEYERLEAELKELYEEYINTYRCLAYLEKLIEDQDKAEQDRLEEKQAATKKLVERLRHEDFSLRTLEGSTELLSGEDSESEEGEVKPAPPPKGRGNRTGARKTAAGGAGGRGAGNARRVFGSMTGGEDDDDSGSLGTDSDLILDGGDGDDGSDLESDELEVENAPGRKSHIGERGDPGIAKAGNGKVNGDEDGVSDDDF